MTLRIVNDVRARCTLTQQYTYELEWVPLENYVAGTQIELRSHCLRAFHSWHYVRMEVERGDVVFRWKINPTPSERRENPHRVIVRAKLPYGVRRGQACKILLTAVPPVWAGISELLSLWVIDIPNNFVSAEGQAVVPQEEPGSTCELTVEAGSVERLSVYARPVPDPDGRVRTVLVPEDRYGNPSAFENPVTARLQWQGKKWELEVGETTVLNLASPSAVGRLEVAVPMGHLSPSENVANGVRQGDELVVTGNPVWPEPVDGLRPAFGEFHWHTEFSGDGQRPIEEALRCARDYLNMDFVAPGDHNTQGEDWQRTVRALDEINVADQFATFYGWENATDRGHENYYFVDPDHPLVCGGKAGFRKGRPDESVNQLARYDGFLAVAHHTNAVAETRKLEDDSPFWHPYPWTEPVPYLRLIEIMQLRGNQERNVYSDAWRGWHQNNRASAQDALALGYKLGFVGGTDNHCGWPGRAYAGHEGGLVHRPKSVILTGAWTSRVERQGVYDALWRRHTWAVWDTRAIVHYTVNGVLMGGELCVARGAELVAHIRLSAEDALQSVEIVSEGASVWVGSFSDLDLELDVALGAADRSTYYYVRALQRDGGIIYASPVFVTVG